MEYIITFALFTIKHYICDFPLQTERHLKKITGNTIEQHYALLDHSGIHAIGTMIAASVTVFWINDYPITAFVLVVIVAGLVDGVLHYMIDLWKVESSKNLSPKDREFWLLLGQDQLFHSLVYVGLVAWVFLTINYGVLP